jgi:hypothetical protein
MPTPPKSSMRRSRRSAHYRTFWQRPSKRKCRNSAAGTHGWSTLMRLPGYEHVTFSNFWLVISAQRCSETVKSVPNRKKLADLPRGYFSNEPKVAERDSRGCQHRRSGLSCHTTASSVRASRATRDRARVTCAPSGSASPAHALAPPHTSSRRSRSPCRECTSVLR